MSNLGLFNGPGGPVYNQSQMMTSDDLQNQFNQERITQQRLANQQSEAMNPLLQQNQDLMNQFQTSKNKGEGGLADQRVAEGDIAKAGTQDTIESNRQTALTKMGSEGVKQMQNLGEAFGQAGATISQLGSGPHTAAIAKSVFDKLNIPEDNGLRQAVLALPPDEMGIKLSELGKQMALHTGSHLQQQNILGTKQQTAFGLQDKKSETAQSIAAAKIEAQGQWNAASNDTKMAIAKMGNETREFLLKYKFDNPQDGVERSRRAYEEATDPEIKAAALAVLDRATQIKAYTNGAQGKLVELYAKGELTEKVLGGPEGLAPNTRPTPVQGGPVAGFPVGTRTPAPTPGASMTPQAPPMATAPQAAPVVEETDPNKVTDAQIVARLSSDPRWKGQPPSAMIAAFRAKYRK